MVFLFKAAIVSAPALDQFKGYEMVAMKNGETNPVKFSDSKRQFDNLMNFYPGVKGEGYEILVKYSLDGKEFSYGRITEMKRTSGQDAAFSIGIESLDAAGKPTGKVMYLGFEYEGALLKKVSYADMKGQGEDAFLEKPGELENCSFTLISVRKGGNAEEWKKAPSAIYTEKLQTLASKISPGLTGDKLLGKDITVTITEGMITDTKTVSIVSPCWTDNVAIVNDKKDNSEEQIDFNANEVEVIKTLDKGKRK